MDSQRNNHLVWALAGAFILTLAAPVYAQGEFSREDRRAAFREKMDQRIEQMHDELGLTPEQRKKLKVHRESKKENRRAFREKIRAKRQALRAELQKPDVNRQRVNALHNEIKQLMNQGADERLEGILYVREVLTPEQYKQFSEKMDSFKNKHGGWRRKGSHDGRRKGSANMPPPGIE